MSNTTQPGANQASNNGNDLELNILNIDSIVIPTHHPRTDIGNLESLQGSLRRDGIQEPILVYEIEPGKYGVYDGVRRLKSFQEFGWKRIPCLIKKGISEAEAAHLS
ncbi:MAG: ParB/RepB/Spo0J family partition protein, partial [Pseudomonadota bacterium]